MGEERSPERAPKHALMTVGTPLRKGKDDGCVLESCPYSWPTLHRKTPVRSRNIVPWQTASEVLPLTYGVWKKTKTLISSFSDMAPSSPLVMRAICWYIHRVYPLCSLLCDQEHKELKKKKKLLGLEVQLVAPRPGKTNSCPWPGLYITNKMSLASKPEWELISKKQKMGICIAQIIRKAQI